MLEDEKKRKRAEYLREYNRRNRERLRELKRQYAQQHRAELSAAAKIRKAARRAQMSPEELEAWRQKNREAVARSYQKHKERRQAEGRAQVAKWRSQDPEKYLAWRKAYTDKNREALAAYKKAYIEANPEKARQTDGMLFLPGQTIAGMLAVQGGKCAVCTKVLQRGRATHVDHCHRTGYVRGLLCHKCNLGIGHFGDSAELLERAIAYVRRHDLRLSTEFRRTLKEDEAAAILS